MLTEIEILHQILKMHQGERSHQERLLRLFQKMGYRTQKQKNGIRIWPAVQKYPVSLQVGENMPISEQEAFMLIPILLKAEGCSMIRGFSRPFIEKAVSLYVSVDVQSDIVMIYGRSGERHGQSC